MAAFRRTNERRLHFVSCHDFLTPPSMRGFLAKWEKILDKWPGKERFGPYRFLPCFFLCGAMIEYSMINWRPNGINFYDTYKAKKAHEEAERRLRNWKEIEKLCQ